MPKELHESEEGTGEKPRCRNMQGQNAKGTGQQERKGKGMRIKESSRKGAETARKLSGKTCKGSKFQVIPRTNKEMKEREGVPGGRLCRGSPFLHIYIYILNKRLEAMSQCSGARNITGPAREGE